MPLDETIPSVYPGQSTVCHMPISIYNINFRKKGDAFAMVSAKATDETSIIL